MTKIEFLINNHIGFKRRYNVETMLREFFIENKEIYINNYDMFLDMLANKLYLENFEDGIILADDYGTGIAFCRNDKKIRKFSRGMFALNDPTDNEFSEYEKNILLNVLSGNYKVEEWWNNDYCEAEGLDCCDCPAKKDCIEITISDDFEYSKKEECCYDKNYC